MKRIERLILNSKASNTFGDKILTRAPEKSDLRDGQISIRKLPTGLYLFTKFNNSLYAARLNLQSDVIIDNVNPLTDSSGGAIDGTVAAISGSGDDSDINNNFAELSGKINSILSKLTEILRKVN